VPECDRAVLWSLSQRFVGGTRKDQEAQGMVVPAELATAASRLKVKRHHRSCGRTGRCASFSSSDHTRWWTDERGWTRSSSTGSGTNQLGVVSGNAAYGYHFRVVSTETPEAPPWSCECSAAGAGSTLNQSSESSEIRNPALRRVAECAAAWTAATDSDLDSSPGSMGSPMNRPLPSYGLIPACHQRDVSYPVRAW